MINDGDTRRDDACRLYISVHVNMCFIFCHAPSLSTLSVLSDGASLSSCRMGTVSQSIEIVALKTENDRLEEKCHTLERQIQDLKKDIVDYQARESAFLAEITDLTAEVTKLRVQQSASMGKFAGMPVYESVQEWLNPRLNAGSSSSAEGVDAAWSDVMMLYTDSIFVECDTPDLPVYRDGNCWRAFDGQKVVLTSPVTEADMNRLNIQGARAATMEELLELEQKYGL